MRKKKKSRKYHHEYLIDLDGLVEQYLGTMNDTEIGKLVTDILKEYEVNKLKEEFRKLYEEKEEDKG